MAKNEKSLPLGVGDFTKSWIVVVAVLLALIVFGGYAYAQQYTQGEVVTGLRNVGSMNGATWGLYVAIYVYLMGLSFAGLTIAALIRLFDFDNLKPIARIAEVLALSSVLIGALTVIVDIGQPLRGLVNLFRYARPQSPFFGTFTIVIAAEIFASLVFLYLGGRRDAAILAKKPGKLKGFFRWWAAGYGDTPLERDRRKTTSFWLSLALVPLLLIAFSTVGLIFGLQVGRPGWFGASRAPGFVILAALSGVGMLVLIAAVLRRTDGLQEQLNEKIFKALANVMMVLNIIYVYLIAVEWFSSFYSAHQGETRISQALISGEYASLFWVTIALLVLPMALLIGQFVLGKYSLSIVVLSGLLVNLAAIGKRYLIVVPSQTHGMLLPYGVGSYSPTWVEYGVVVGLIAFGVLLYALFVKVFPILEIKTAEGGA